MKTLNILSLAIALVLLSAGTEAQPDQSGSEKKNSSQVVNLFTTPSLENLASQWAENFAAGAPEFEARVAVNTTEVSGFDNKAASQGLYLTAGMSGSSASWSTSWSSVIGRDPVMIIISDNHPDKDLLRTTGISVDRLKKLLETNDSGTILIADHAQTIEAMKSLTGISTSALISPAEINQLMVSGTTAIMIAPYSVLEQPERMFENKQIVPIDLNNNQALDHVENIYDNQEAFFRGLWIGKYPKALCNSLRIYSNHTPLSDAENAFMRYILTAGQNQLWGTSYVNLSYTEQQSSLARIPVSIPINPALKVARSSTMTVLFYVLVMILMIGLTVYLSKIRSKGRKVASPAKFQPLVLNPEKLRIPKGIFFDRSHTWAFMEQDGTVKVGVDDFLQHITGPITSTQIKAVGETVERGQALLTISQKGKKIQVLSPISGKITGKNYSLESSPYLLNTSPFENGWVCRIEPENWAVESKLLILSPDYLSWIKNEFTRFKDFLQEAFRKQETELALVSLPDGGEIIDEILSQFGPETWEDFESQFMTNHKNN